MATMNAIEITDAEDGASRRIVVAKWIAKDFHTRNQPITGSRNAVASPGARTRTRRPTVS